MLRYDRKVRSAPSGISAQFERNLHVLDSETKKGCHFFQTAGKTQLPKRLIVGKDRAAGKVLAGKSVIFAFCGVVGSKGRTPPASFYEKSWL